MKSLTKPHIQVSEGLLDDLWDAAMDIERGMEWTSDIYVGSPISKRTKLYKKFSELCPGKVEEFSLHKIVGNVPFHEDSGYYSGLGTDENLLVIINAERLFTLEPNEGRDTVQWVGYHDSSYYLYDFYHGGINGAGFFFDPYMYHGMLSQYTVYLAVAAYKKGDVK